MRNNYTSGKFSSILSLGTIAAALWLAVAPVLDANACGSCAAPGSISGNQSVCGSFDPSVISNVTYPSGGSGTIYYMWEQKTVGGTWATVSGATSATFDPTSITVSMVYRRLARQGTFTNWADSNEVTKTVKTIPSVSCSATNGSCTNGNVGSTTASGSGCTSDTCSWSNGATTQSMSDTGTYSVSVIDINGCSNSDDITLNLSGTPGLDIELVSGINPLCAGSTVVLGVNAPEALTYLWSTGETTETITVSTAGEYTVEIVGFNGCSSADTISIDVYDLPTVAIDITSGTNPLCQGDSLQLTAVSATASSYQWTTGSTDQSIWVNTTGTYRVNVVDANGCENFAELAVNVVATPPVDVTVIAGDNPFCAGDSVQVTAQATGATGWSWSNGATTQSIWATAAGTYTVTVNDTNGCAGNGSISVGVNEPPVVSVDVTSGTNPTCEGNTVGLTANSATGTSWIWTNGYMTQSTTVSVTGTYCVSVQDANGCATVSCIDLIVNPNPTVSVDITAGAQPFCEGDSIQLTATTTDATMVVWNTGETTASIWVSATGTFEATASNSGCAATGSISVVVNPAPTVSVDITSGAEVFCTGDSVQLTANATGATSYLWVNGATTQSIWVTSGNYYCVTLMNDAFCSASACRTVTEVTSPTVDLGPDVFICQDSVTVLAVQNPISGATYTWTVDGNVVGNGTSISVSPSVGITEYIVTVDVNCGTTASDAIKVHVSEAVIASFTRDPAGIVILGNNVQFTNTSTGNPNTFEWNFGDGGTDVVNNPAHMYMAQGVYDVTLIASNGLCSATATGSAEVQVIIDVPKPFTPNNDGYNDMVWITGADNEMLYMHVFSRWGHLVWEGQGRTLEWDGKSNSGVELEEGTYYYVINITPEGGATKTQTGFITLLR